jgi:hypothetical protein
MCVQHGVDVRMQRLQEVAAALLEAPFHTERGVLQDGAGSELGNDLRRGMDADQQEELSLAPIELLDEPVGFVEVVAREPAQTVVQTDDLGSDSLLSEKGSRHTFKTQETAATGLLHRGMIPGDPTRSH